MGGGVKTPIAFAKGFDPVGLSASKRSYTLISAPPHGMLLQVGFGTVGYGMKLPEREESEAP